MKYEIDITQTFTETFEIEADSEGMAIALASEQLAGQILSGGAMPYEDVDVYPLEEE